MDTESAHQSPRRTSCIHGLAYQNLNSVPPCIFPSKAESQMKRSDWRIQSHLTASNSKGDWENASGEAGTVGNTRIQEVGGSRKHSRMSFPWTNLHCS